jgi:hypothetical protein
VFAMDRGPVWRCLIKIKTRGGRSRDTIPLIINAGGKIFITKFVKIRKAKRAYFTILF